MTKNSKIYIISPSALSYKCDHCAYLKHHFDLENRGVPVGVTQTLDKKQKEFFENNFFHKFFDHFEPEGGETQKPVVLGPLFAPLRVDFLKFFMKNYLHKKSKYVSELG